MEKKRYIEKFVLNKKVPNEIFTLSGPKGNQLSINLKDTVERIYETGQGLEVKKLLKKGEFRNATIEQCLKLFEGAAQRFMLDDYNLDVSKKVQDVLGKAHRRKNGLFLKFQEEEVFLTHEVILTERKDYLLKNLDNEKVQSFDKKSFVEFLAKVFEDKHVEVI